MPRAHGETPKHMGNFETLVPTPQSDELVKLVGGQKMFGSNYKQKEKPSSLRKSQTESNK